jgi:predicted nucleotidyltransferase component of viral defense system
MLDRDDLSRWARVFGAADEQIRRDHLLSHIVAALSEIADQDLVFYGGTALARAHLPMFRLSEDLDFLARLAQRVDREDRASPASGSAPALRHHHMGRPPHDGSRGRRHPTRRR